MPAHAYAWRPVQERTHTRTSHLATVWLSKNLRPWGGNFCYHDIHDHEWLLIVISMKMSEGGRVVIPAEIRQAMGLKEGDTVLWELRDGKALLTTRATQLREAQAMVRKFVPAGVSLSDELIAERRAENARDEAA